MFNQAWFNGLPADLQKIVVEEGRALQAKGRAAVRKIGPDLLKIVETEGVQVVPLSAAEREVFEKKTIGVRAVLRQKQGAATVRVLDKVEARLRTLRGGQ
jgi:TRAP-type C4-dicarboxylate transport system substrate-binding protein